MQKTKKYDYKIKEEIKEYLNSIPDLFFLNEYNGNFSSFIICFKSKFIYLLCKINNKTPTIIQQIIINKIKRAGGFVAVVISIGDVKKIIKGAMSGSISNS